MLKVGDKIKVKDTGELGEIISIKRFYPDTYFDFDEYTVKFPKDLFAGYEAYELEKISNETI